MNPMQYSVYKGTGGKFGAAQFNFQPPHFYKEGTKLKDFEGRVGTRDQDAFQEVDGKRKLKEGWKEREGAIFLEMAPTVDKNKYDWANKVIMALSVNDLGKLLFFLATGQSSNSKDEDKTMTIMHDPHAKTSKANQVQKYLTVKSPKGTKAGCLMQLTQTGENKRSHTVPLTGDEMLTLRTLVNSAISRALNW